MCLKLHLYVRGAYQCMCDVVKKLVFVKRLVFSGQRVSQGEELSTRLICAAGIRHRQRRPPMSNVTALISFQCSPGITAGARDRHTSLLHRMRFPGDCAIHKSTGFILMKSIASCHFLFCARLYARSRNFGQHLHNATIFQFLQINGDCVPVNILHCGTI